VKDDIEVQIYAFLHGGSFALVFSGVVMSSIYYAILNQVRKLFKPVESSLSPLRVCATV
jgi:hypothetical protein